MHLGKIAEREHQRQSYFVTLLYAFLYLLLWLHHCARKAYIALHTFFKRIRLASLKKRTYKHPRLQNHLAISGAISSHLEQLAHFVAFTAACGTHHITLYDHLQSINPARLTFFLCQQNLHSVQILEIGIEKTRTHFSQCESHESHHRCCLTKKKPPHPPEILVTLVNPGTGRAVIARSARMLAHQQTIDSPEITPDYVLNWLDRDEACCMLPSEPDTLVVFPPSGGRSIPVLNEFPVWQLRLTQIRFSARPITHLSTEEFSDMVSSAARAPKRFGR